MNRLAALLARGTPSEAAFAAYAAAVGPEEAAAARALLGGQRPKRLAPAATLLTWVAEATQTPAELVAACLAVSKDRAEVAALLLPLPPAPAPGQPPCPSPTLTLTQALPHLASRAAFLKMAQSLAPPARLLFTRLAAGTLRSRIAAPPPPAQTAPGRCLALLTLLDPSGPEITLALPQGNGLVPLTRLRLTLAETPQILAWARAHTTDRFGPLRQVTPAQVFELAFDGTTPNARRKCGLDLIAPRLIAWRQDLTPDQVPPANSLHPG